LCRLLILSGVSRLIANHLILTRFVSAPEVRVLPSTGVTRLQQYYDPVRLPLRPPPFATSRPLPSPKRASPVACITFPPCRAHYPGGPDGCARRLLPHLCGLPRIAGGSASASSLSRPAQALPTLRPAGLLDRPRRPLSRGFSVTSYPATLLVSYQTYRQLSGWILPPLVIHALRGTRRYAGRHCPGVASLARATISTRAQTETFSGQLVNRAGTPTAVQPGGTSCSTTAPAPILAKSPMLISPTTVDPALSKTPLPIFGARSGSECFRPMVTFCRIVTSSPITAKAPMMMPVA